MRSLEEIKRLNALAEKRPVKTYEQRTGLSKPAPEFLRNSHSNAPRSDDAHDFRNYGMNALQLEDYLIFNRRTGNGVMDEYDDSPTKHLGDYDFDDAWMKGRSEGLFKDE